MNDEPIYQELFPEGIYIIPEPAGANTTDYPDTAKVEKVNTETKSSPEADVEEAPALPEFRGSNKKNVVILYDDTLSQQCEEFLFKVLAAVKLTLDDIALVSYSSNMETWTSLPAGQVLVFGCSSLEQGDAEMYLPSARADRVFLHADSLEHIMTDRSLKSRLWDGLKQMFSL